MRTRFKVTIYHNSEISSFYVQAYDLEDAYDTAVYDYRYDDNVSVIYVIKA
jgi:hypothetical protein